LKLQAGALVATVRHLKLEIFSLKKEEQVLKDILSTVANLLQKHATPQTVRSCCQALSYCANPGGDAPQVHIWGEASTGVLHTGEGLVFSTWP
jgi:hypothetical protein